ncbi:MAG: hypothetical protein KDB07_08100, partial [Planctomycetes bacterium]|nr:hypothetical protein [Planctomycetota bacterium]
MFVITPILSATGIMLGVSAAVAIAIVVNEAGVFLKARKQGGEGAAKPKREKLSKKAKRKIEKTSGSEAYKAALVEEAYDDPYAAFNIVNSAGVEPFNPVGLDE